MNRISDWVSVHIFYNARDLRPVVLGCVDTLVAKLKRSELISKFFFIRYWEGGSHVRLRLHAVEGEAAEVREIVAADVGAFLVHQPALFDADRGEMRAMIRTLHEFEFGKESFAQQFGSGDDIFIYDNNSFHFIEYEPEFLRYGGKRGIELAHKNFHISSMIAIRALSENNTRMERMVLGIAFQSTLQFAYTFFQCRERVEEFFVQYIEFFSKLRRAGPEPGKVDTFLTRQSEGVAGYVNELETMHARLHGRADNPLGEYIRHAEEMRDSLTEAYYAGDLEFSFPADTAQDALFRLVTSYIHMNNNRLGLLIFEEIYLAGLIVEALRASK